MGIGIRDESTSQFIYIKGMDYGHWYQDADGNLYIMPDARFDDSESLGPDNEHMTALNEAYRTRKFDDIDQDELAEELGLEFVPNVLHRFDKESGFYSA